jgi:hypothetical protein
MSGMGMNQQPWDEQVPGRGPARLGLLLPDC